MPSDEFLDGETLTGRQAAIIFFGFLGFIILSESCWCFSGASSNVDEPI